MYMAPEVRSRLLPEWKSWQLFQCSSENQAPHVYISKCSAAPNARDTECPWKSQHALLIGSMCMTSIC